MDRMWTLQVVN